MQGDASEPIEERDKTAKNLHKNIHNRRGDYRIAFGGIERGDFGHLLAQHNVHGRDHRQRDDEGQSRNQFCEKSEIFGQNQIVEIGCEKLLKGIFANCAESETNNGNTQLRCGNYTISCGGIFQPAAYNFRSTIAFTNKRVDSSAARGYSREFNANKKAVESDEGEDEEDVPDDHSFF